MMSRVDENTSLRLSGRIVELHRYLVSRGGTSNADILLRRCHGWALYDASSSSTRARGTFVPSVANTRITRVDS